MITLNFSKIMSLVFVFLLVTSNALYCMAGLDPIGALWYTSNIFRISATVGNKEHPEDLPNVVDDLERKLQYFSGKKSQNGLFDKREKRAFDVIRQSVGAVLDVNVDKKDEAWERVEKRLRPFVDACDEEFKKELESKNDGEKALIDRMFQLDKPELYEISDEENVKYAERFYPYLMRALRLAPSDPHGYIAKNLNPLFARMTVFMAKKAPATKEDSLERDLLFGMANGADMLDNLFVADPTKKRGPNSDFIYPALKSARGVCDTTKILKESVAFLIVPVVGDEKQEEKEVDGKPKQPKFQKTSNWAGMSTALKYRLYVKDCNNGRSAERSRCEEFASFIGDDFDEMAKHNYDTDGKLLVEDSKAAARVLGDSKLNPGMLNADFKKEHANIRKRAMPVASNLVAAYAERRKTAQPVVPQASSFDAPKSL
jgi:hypothetical protein